MFNTSERKARYLKNIILEHGMLALPNLKTGRALTPEIEILIQKIYKHDGMSRMMPGIKDFESVKNVDGTRSHIRKGYYYAISTGYMLNLHQNTKA